MSDKDKLPVEWENIFECTNNNPSALNFTVENINPVFVWKSRAKTTVKLRKQLEPHQFTTTVKILSDKKYQFDLPKGTVDKFKNLINDLRKMDGDSWNNKWDNVLARGFPSPKKIEETPLQSNQSLFRSNSSLIRLNGTLVEKVIQLHDGQGICLNDQGHICVVDNGNGILLFDENLEYFNTINLQDFGIELTFDGFQKKFYITSENCISTIDASNFEFVPIFQIPNPISVRVYYGSTYILSGNNLTYIIKITNGYIPISLFDIQWVSFSDFIIFDEINSEKNIAYILDSFSGNIYKYNLLTGEMSMVDTLKYQPSGNPQCICSYEHNQILISEPKNKKIVSFIPRNSDSFQYFWEYTFEDFRPNKITTKGQFIFTTGLNDRIYQNQPLESPSINVCNQQDQISNTYSFFEANIPINFDQSSSQIFFSCTTQGDLDKLLGLSSGALLFQFLNLPKEHVMNIEKSLKQLETFIQIVYKVSEKQEDKYQFLRNWYHVFKIFNMLTNFKLSSNSNSHLSTNFKALDGNQDEQYFSPGKIVFVDSYKQFSFQKTDQSISVGIICGSQNSKNIFPICIFGSCLVRVFVPKQIQSIDERGMFVILNKNISNSNKENIGIGEIISFGEMIIRESNSYEIAGICALGKLGASESKSLYLYSSFSENTESIPFPITNEVYGEICFVLMVSLPMSKFLLNLFVPTLGIKSTPHTYQLDDAHDYYIYCSGDSKYRCHDVS